MAAPSVQESYVSAVENQQGGSQLVSHATSPGGSLSSDEASFYPARSRTSSMASSRFSRDAAAAGGVSDAPAGSYLTAISTYNPPELQRAGASTHVEHAADGQYVVLACSALPNQVNGISTMVVRTRDLVAFHVLYRQATCRRLPGL